MSKVGHYSLGQRVKFPFLCSSTFSGMFSEMAACIPIHISIWSVNKALTTCARASIAQVCKHPTPFNSVIWYSRPYTFYEIDSDLKHDV